MFGLRLRGDEITTAAIALERAVRAISHTPIPHRNQSSGTAVLPCRQIELV
jgi:hypothetical protein